MKSTVASTRALAFVSLALLAATSAWTGAAQTSVPSPPQAPMDARLESVLLASAAPEWRDGSPTHASLAVTVGNEGQVAIAYRIEMTWKADGVSTPLNGDEAASFDASRQPLGAGTSRTHTIPWILQPGQAGLGSVVATVRLADGGLDQDPQDNQASLAVPVAVRSLSFILEGTAGDIEPGGTGFVRLAVRNDGNVPESVPVSLVAPPTDPRFQALVWPPVVEVAAGTFSAAALLVRFLPDGDFAPLAQTFRLRADAPFGDDVEIETPQFRSSSGSGDLSGFASSLTRSQTAAASLRGGVAADIPLELRNTGSRPDNYTFIVEAPTGWQADLAPSRSSLFAGEGTVVSLRVTPPESAPSGQQATLRVTSRGSLDPTARTLTVEARIGGASPQASPLSLPHAPYKDQDVEVQAVLANVGDLPLAASTATVEWHMGAVVRQATAAVPQLLPGASWPLDVRAPAPEGGGNIDLRLLWPANAVAAATTSFVHAPALVLEAPQPLAGQAGETVAYQGAGSVFRVRNEGNAAETVHLEAASDPGSAELGSSATFQLAVGQVRSVSVVQQLPDPTGSATEATLVLRAGVGGQPPAWQASVATRIEDTIAPVLAPATLPATWQQGKILGLSVAIEERGAVRSAHAVVTPLGLPAERLALVEASGQWNATVTLQVPGPHAIHFEAIDAAGNLAASPDQVVQAADVPAPRLELSLPPGAAVGPRTKLTITVHDELAVLAVRVSLQRDGVEVERMVPVVGGVATLSLAALGPLPAGPFDLHIEVANAGGATSSAALQLTVAEQASASPAPTKGHDAAGPGWAILAIALLFASSRRLA